MSEKLKLSQAEIRQMQLIELEMLVEVDRICRKNHIKYSLDGGTMLGAVRHKGFIPWDDDADVIFSRHEYAKFYKACKKDLDQERFFLQEYRTDPNYRWGYAKMRRRGTEFVRSNQEHMKYVTGICIDIFPEDNVPDEYIQRRVYYGINYCIRKILYSELGMKAEKSPFKRTWYRLLYKIPRDPVFKIRNRLAAYYNRKPSKLVAHTMYPNPGPTCKYGMPAESLADFEQMEFEGMMFSVSKDWDNFLRLSYGDYMQLPPVEKRKGPAEPSKLQLIDITLEEIQERYRRENARL
jgi:lipopolysaccharide cholinephosphotransferase